MENLRPEKMLHGFLFRLHNIHVLHIEIKNTGKKESDKRR